MLGVVLALLEFDLYILVYQHETKDPELLSLHKHSKTLSHKFRSSEVCLPLILDLILRVGTVLQELKLHAPAMQCGIPDHLPAHPPFSSKGPGQ